MPDNLIRSLITLAERWESDGYNVHAGQLRAVIKGWQAGVRDA